MPETDDDLFRFHAPADVGLRLVGARVALLDLERELVGAAMLRAAQRADAGGDRRVDVRAGTCNNATREGGGVELVLSVQNERRMHRPHPRGSWRAPMQQVQKMPADAVVVGLHLDAPAVL